MSCHCHLLLEQWNFTFDFVEQKILYTISQHTCALHKYMAVVNKKGPDYTEGIMGITRVDLSRVTIQRA